MAQGFFRDGSWSVPQKARGGLPPGRQFLTGALRQTVPSEVLGPSPRRLLEIAYADQRSQRRGCGLGLIELLRCRPCLKSSTRLTSRPSSRHRLLDCWIRTQQASCVQWSWSLFFTSTAAPKDARNRLLMLWPQQWRLWDSSRSVDVLSLAMWGG